MHPLEKRKQENIAGYVIGMWQVEDLMRAADFDMDVVEERLILGMEGDEQARAEMRDWYAGIMARMKEQGITRVGHLAELEEVMQELEYLHRSLIDTLMDEEYIALDKEAAPGISAVQRRAGGDPEGPIESSLTAVYGVMLLRTQGKHLSEETQAADASIRKLLDRLSLHYRNMRRLPGVSLN